MSCLQLTETSLRQACITPRGVSQVVFYGCSIADKIKKNDLGGRGVAGVGERKGAYRVTMGQPDGTSPLRKLRLRLEDNINMDLKEVDLRHGLD